MQTFTANQTYTGPTFVQGSGLTLQDGGRLSATNSVDVNYAQLALIDTAAMAVADRSQSQRPAHTAGRIPGFQRPRVQRLLSAV
jgi:hypothetical protein